MCGQSGCFPDAVEVRTLVLGEPENEVVVDDIILNVFSSVILDLLKDVFSLIVGNHRCRPCGAC